MSGRSLTLEIKSGDTVKAYDFTQATNEMFVGRSHTCQLQTPEDDRTVSRQHVRIFWKGKTAWIEDHGSTTGVLVDGHPLVKPAKLNPKAVYSLGGTLLTVKQERSSKRVRGEKYHRLEFLTGDQEHKMVEIRPNADSTGGAFTIGRSPDNDLVLNTDTVSDRHVSFIVKRDGGCWIQDRGSLNKTYVNGEILSGRERFLHSGDKITISYYEFRFHHKDDIPPVDWKKLLFVMVMLGTVLASAWVVLNGMRTKPDAFRALAVKLAAEENFAGAYQAVTNAYTAPHGGTELERRETDTLKRQIAVWSETDKAWKSVQDDLAAGHVGMVRSALGELFTPDSQGDKWGWNGLSAVTKQADAAFTYDLIKRIYAVFDLLQEKSSTGPRLGSAIQAIDTYLQTNTARFAELTYLTAPTNKLMTFRRRMQALKDGIDRIDLAIDSVNLKKPDFTAAIKTLETVPTTLPEGIRSHAAELLKTARQFQTTQQFLKREFAVVTELDFKEVQVLANQLPLPSKDECARHRLFSDARDVFVAQHRENQRLAETVAPMVRNLEAAGVAGGVKGNLVEQIMDPKVWEKALSFDCFTGRFPEPSRLDPNSLYDRLFGIECTYENLHQLPKMTGRAMNVRLRFVPLTQKARALFEQVHTFMAALERPENAGFRTGKLGDLYTLCEQILEQRDKLIAFLRARRPADAPKGAEWPRDQILAGFFAEYFTEDPSYANLRALEMAFKKLERRVAQMEEEIGTEVDPEKRLALMKQILATGVPGNSNVRKSWVKLMVE